MSQATVPIIIHVSNSAALKGRGSILVLESADECAAKKVAHKIADKTGRCVTVRGADMTLIETIPAARIH